MKIEICSDSIESVIMANNIGVDSIELCSCLSVGGVTPSIGLIKDAISISDAPINCLIRPREGHFIYNDKEFDTIINDIKYAIKFGVKGIVIGVLNGDFKINISQLSKIAEVSQDVGITFHRAFDNIVDSKEAIDILESFGVNRILSSGKANTAIKGIENLIDWKNYNSNILIQPGGGINKESALIFKNNGFESIHLSGTENEKWSGYIPESIDETFLNQTVRRPSVMKIKSVVDVAKKN